MLPRTLSAQTAVVPTSPHPKNVTGTCLKKKVTLKTIEKLTFSKARDRVLTLCIYPSITFASVITKRTSPPSTSQPQTGPLSSRPPSPKWVLFLLPEMPPLKFIASVSKHLPPEQPLWRHPPTPPFCSKNTQPPFPQVYQRGPRAQENYPIF